MAYPPVRPHPPPDPKGGAGATPRHGPRHSATARRGRPVAYPKGRPHRFPTGTARQDSEIGRGSKRVLSPTTPESTPESLTASCE